MQSAILVLLICSACTHTNGRIQVENDMLIFTQGGNSKGAMCVFPFTYNSATYPHCCTAPPRTQYLWCATTSDFNQDGLWGWCNVNPAAYTDGGDLCQPTPFVHLYQSYARCSSDSPDHKLWCLSPDGEKKACILTACRQADPFCYVRTESGAPCHFPSVWKGTVQHGCLKKSAHSAICCLQETCENWGKCLFEPVMTESGSPCLFPFIWKGRTYRRCIRKEHNRLWCCIKLTFEGKCDDSDDAWSDCVERVQTLRRTMCSFPFTWNGQRYFRCIKQERTRPWCCTDEICADWDYCLTQGTQNDNSPPDWTNNATNSKQMMTKPAAIITTNAFTTSTSLTKLSEYAATLEEKELQLLANGSVDILGLYSARKGNVTRPYSMQSFGLTGITTCLILLLVSTFVVSAGFVCFKCRKPAAPQVDSSETELLKKDSYGVDNWQDGSAR